MSYSKDERLVELVARMLWRLAEGLIPSDGLDDGWDGESEAHRERWRMEARENFTLLQARAALDHPPLEEGSDDARSSRLDEVADLPDPALTRECPEPGCHYGILVAPTEGEPTENDIIGPCPQCQAAGLPTESPGEQP